MSIHYLVWVKGNVRFRSFVRFFNAFSMEWACSESVDNPDACSIPQYRVAGFVSLPCSRSSSALQQFLNTRESQLKCLADADEALTFRHELCALYLFLLVFHPANRKLRVLFPGRNTPLSTDSPMTPFCASM